jgi:hypothetical protein
MDISERVCGVCQNEIKNKKYEEYVAECVSHTLEERIAIIEKKMYDQFNTPRDRQDTRYA